MHGGRDTSRVAIAGDGITVPQIGSMGEDLLPKNGLYIGLRIAQA